jgi:hypothetical protein
MCASCFGNGKAAAAAASRNGPLGMEISKWGIKALFVDHTVGIGSSRRNGYLCNAAIGRTDGLWMIPCSCCTSSR